MQLLKAIKNTVEKGSGYSLLLTYLIAKSGGKSSKDFSIVFLSKYTGLSNTSIVQYITNIISEIVVNENNKLTIKIHDQNVVTKYIKVEPKAQKSDKENKLIDTVLLMLNEVTGKDYKLKTQSHRKHIRARIREGMTLDDFQYVIQIKSMEWLNTKDLYLRPQTLFGTNMDSYRNQKIISENKPKLAQINEAINKAKSYNWESPS